MTSLADHSFAVKFRQVIEGIVDDVLNSKRPQSRTAVVVAVDTINVKAEVQFAGEDTTSWVGMTAVQPATPGQMVVIGGPSGNRYITEVLAGFIAGPGLLLTPSAGVPAIAATPIEGMAYYDGTLNQMVVYDGANWMPVSYEPHRSVSQVVKTNGDFSTASTSYTLVTDCTITVAAAAGDKLEIGVSSRWGNEATTKRLDAYSFNGGVYCSGVGSGGTGVAAWGGINGSLTPFGGAIHYTCGSGDIASGLADIRLHVKMSTAVTGTLDAADPPLHFWVRNTGP